MNTEQIEQLCRSDQVLSPKFEGVFSRDNLPDLAEDAKFYVCNTYPSSELVITGWCYTQQQRVGNILIRLVVQ